MMVIAVTDSARCISRITFTESARRESSIRRSNSSYFNDIALAVALESQHAPPRGYTTQTARDGDPCGRPAGNRSSILPLLFATGP